MKDMETQDKKSKERDIQVEIIVNKWRREYTVFLFVMAPIVCAVSFLDNMDYSLFDFIIDFILYFLISLTCNVFHCKERFLKDRLKLYEYFHPDDKLIPYIDERIDQMYD